MFDAMDIARHLIRCGYDEFSPSESVFICPLRLQKFLYYCQGWSLGIFSRPLFCQPMEAWTYGPVVVDVYRRFDHTRNPLTPEQMGEPTALLNGTIAKLVETVWHEYSRYTPAELVHMTHQEPPWKEARGDLPSDARCNNKLSLDTMTSFFRSEVQRRSKRSTSANYPVIDPIAAWKADEEFERSGRQSIPANEVFAQLLGEVG